MCPARYYQPMASWTDGAAYAPIERPDGFATPEVEPLADTDNPVATTAGAVPPPREFRQDVAVTPLGQVRTAPLPRRNPSEPFLVSGGLMTTASSMGEHTLRDPRAPFTTLRETDGSRGVDALPPPTGEPLVMGIAGPPGTTGTGLDALMSSGMTRRTAVADKSPTEVSTLRTLVFLAVAFCFLGFTIGFVAPYMLIVAGLLSLRASFLTGKAGSWAIGVGLALIMAGFIVTPGLEDLLGRLACLSFGIWFVKAAVGRSRGGTGR